MNRTCLGLALVLVAGCTTAPPAVGPTTRLEVIAADIGSGICVLVMCPNGNAVLNDCGTLEGKESELKKSGIKLIRESIDGLGADGKLYVVTSHPDKDHVNMIPDIVDQHLIDTKLVTFYQNVRVDEYNKKLGEWINRVKLANKNVAVLAKTEGSEPAKPLPGLRCVADGGVFVLANDIGVSKNDKSAVLLYNGPDNLPMAITTGDAEDGTLNFMINHRAKNIMRKRLLIVPHHGSDNGTNSAAWVTASQPQILFFSAGNRYGHPRCTVVESYKTQAVLLTKDHDLLCFQAKPPAWITKRFASAEFSTHSSGALIFTVEKTDRKVSYSIATCPDNLRRNCQQQKLKDGLVDERDETLSRDD